MYSPHHSGASTAKSEFWLTQASAAATKVWTFAVKAFGMRKRRDRYIREQIREQFAGRNFSFSNITLQQHYNFILRDRGTDESQSARKSRLELQPMLEESETLKQIHSSAGENREEAIPRYQQYIDDHPGSSLAYAYLGGDLQKLGRFEESLAAHQQGARIRHSAFSNLIIGDVLKDLGRFDDAIAEYRKIIDGDKSHFLYQAMVGRAYLHLGDVLKLKGRKREARASWKHAMRSEQTKEVRAEALKRLKE